jgi:hypothetical protein
MKGHGSFLPNRVLCPPNFRISQQEIARRKAAEKERDATIAELEKALTEVRTLRGLIPICANCKSIRDDQGYWQQLEIYIQDHSDAVFSHGICPDCFQKLYPDMDL